MRELLERLSREGFTVLAYDIENVGAFIITPSDNVIYVYETYGAYKFALEYKPTKGCGNGCECMENVVATFDRETVLEAERLGLAFARRLHATLYRNSAEWLGKYWNREKLFKVEDKNND